jgi:hypothetical protein
MADGQRPTAWLRRAMTFTPHQITSEPDGTNTPQPGRDVHWWRIDRPSDETGWVYVAQSVPPPSEEWIAGELNRQEAKMGHAFEGLLVSSGFHLAMAPRPD